MESGLCIVLSNPATAAFSSELSALVLFVERSFLALLPGLEYVASIEFRGVISGMAKVPFSEMNFSGELDTSACLFASAIAETAISTFRSNSSSLTVKDVRSKLSMNCMAPDKDDR